MASGEFVGVQVHKDVTCYEERIYGGVTGRQAAAIGIAGTVSVALGWLLTGPAGMPFDAAAYVVMVACAPPVVLSMAKPGGLAPETYAELVAAHLLNPQRLTYRAATAPMSSSSSRSASAP